jgi:hypothetical protein
MFTPCCYHGVKSLFRQPISPTAHYSDSPFLRQPITPTAHFSDNPLFRHPITPTMTNIYINFVIFLKPGPGAIKHENLLKYEKILNCSMSYPHFVFRLSPLHGTQNVYPRVCGTRFISI